MPAMTKTYILGGAALLALLLGSKKSSAKSSSSKSSDQPSDKPAENKEQGDVGEPAGPKGCKPGLVNKNGTCVKPDTGTGGTGTGTGTGGGTLKPEGIYISNDCKTVKFGDKTGESWWKIRGKKMAQQWLGADYTNLIYIAYEMLRSNKDACFKDFPTTEKYPVSLELHKARIDWIVKYPAIWSLLVTIRNFIDKDLLSGKTYVGMIEKNKLILEFTKNFNFEAFWETIEPLAYTILYLEEEKPGSVLKKFGDTYPAYDKPGSEVRNSCIVLFVILFPYIDKTKIFKQFSGNLDSTELYNNIWDNISDLENESIDYSEYEKL